MTVTLPPTGYEFATAAEQQYVERYGSTLVMNTYLKVALLLVSLVALGLIGLNVRTEQTLRHFKPLVIRIDDVGRATAVTYGSFAYQPQAPELKYFLVQFVTDHDSRVRATIRDRYARSLYFLDGRLANATMDAGRAHDVVAAFLANPVEETEIVVKNVVLEDLSHPPFRASVEFEKVFYSPADHVERRREAYVAHVWFVVKDSVPNAWIPVNPLGLTITDFREDQAFR